ncbi:MAG: Hsp20/alpha crystallin family protein [Pseudomonadota bacterium]
MLTLWNPQRELFNWSREFEDLFNWNAGNGNRTGLTPAVDIEEKEDSFVLKADLPGVEEKEIEVKVHDGTLLLTGKREESKEEEKEGMSYRERSYGSFCRQFRLGAKIDSEKIGAEYKNGVLTVVLPKKEDAKPREIPISVK